MKNKISELKLAAGMLSIAKEKIGIASKLLPEPTPEDETTIDWAMDINDANDSLNSCISSIEERIKNER